VRLREEKLDRATVEVTYRPAIGLSNVQSKVVEQAVETLVEASLLAGLHPRTLVQVTAQNVHDAGSSLAATLNATSMALLDAGLPLKAVPAAVACAVMPDGSIWIDPTLAEEQEATSYHVFAFDTLSQEVVYSTSTGLFNSQTLSDCYTLCQAGAAKIHAFYRVALERKLLEDGLVA
jgi:exosome complex component RRP46